MFLFENARGECLDSVVFHHRHCALGDDWATIERLVDKVDRTTTHLHAVRERLSLRIQPGKAGKRLGWMFNIRIRNASIKHGDKRRM